MADPSTADRISQAALAILEAEGPGAVSMRRVADSAGITPMAIYHHFPNRESLLNTITNQQFATFLCYIEKRPMRGSAEAQLISAMEAYIDYAFDRPRIFDYVFSSPAPEHAVIPTTSASVVRPPSTPSPTRSTAPCAPACSAKTMSGKLPSNSGPSPTDTSPSTVPAASTCPKRNSAPLSAAP